MKKTFTVLGALLGFTVGYSIARAVQDSDWLSAETALKIIKKSYDPTSKIIGSWINTTPGKLSDENFTLFVYEGGLTVKDSKQNQIDYLSFLIDAKDGHIVHIEKEKTTTASG